MTKINPDLVRNIITVDNELTVPKVITGIIANNLKTEAGEIIAEGEKLKKEYDSYQRLNVPAVISYVGESRIDAYTVYYLPRNTLIPKIAILYCSYHEAFQNIPDKIRVLDIGSGTGGVIIGLLDMFNNEELQGTQLDILAVDDSAEGLIRQKELVRDIGLNNSTHRTIRVDVHDLQAYENIITQNAPYDIIFIANVFAELSVDAIDNILRIASNTLSEQGIIVNVEPHSTYIMNQKVRIAKMVGQLELNIYLPCPPEYECTQPDCWIWRNDGFECSTIDVGGNVLLPTDVQKAFWTILSKQPYSIHEALNRINPSLSWGVIGSRYKKRVTEEEVQQDYQVCRCDGHKFITDKKRKKGKLPSLYEPYKRGAFIGYTDDYSTVEFWDIL